MPYSLKHGVNLSRRACRRPFIIYILLLMMVTAINNYVAAETTDEALPISLPIAPSAGGHFTPDPDMMSNSFEETYPGLQFGPMGPKDRDSTDKKRNPSPELRTGGSGGYSDTTPLNGEDGSTESGVETITKKEIKRYPIFVVEFHRVETPFIIGLWIFCASLAKIGKFIYISLIHYTYLFRNRTQDYLLASKVLYHWGHRLDFYPNFYPKLFNIFNENLQ